MDRWYYNEFKQTGIDFRDEREVLEYDEKYKAIRNYDNETELIAGTLNLSSESRILELGCGTGENTMRLSKLCKEITACDVSETMLGITKEKLKVNNVKNVKLVNAGFLSFESEVEYYDGIVSQLALHHLPDFWKSVALLNVARVLKPEGRFYLLDSILAFNPTDYQATIEPILKYVKEMMGEKLTGEIIVNLRDEYPTYDWILERFIEYAGMNVISKIKYSPIMSAYTCCKI